MYSILDDTQLKANLCRESSAAEAGWERRAQPEFYE